MAAFQGVAASALGPLADLLALALAREGKMEYGPVRAAGSISYMVMTAAVGQGLALAGRHAGALDPGGWAMASPRVFARLLPEALTPPAAPQRARRLGVVPVAAVSSDGGLHRADPGLARRVLRVRRDLLAPQGIGDATIGLLFAEGIIAEIALFLRGRRLVERLGPAGLTACAAARRCGALDGTALAPPLPVLALLQLLHAATFAMQHLAAMMLLSRTVPPERAATAQALHSALGQGVPNGLMMLLTGFLYARVGGGAFLAMAVASGLALGLVGPLRRVAR